MPPEQAIPQQSDTHPSAPGPATTIDLAQSPDPLGQPKILHRVVNLIFILVPVAGLVGGCIYAWGRGFGWVELALLVGMYLATGLGITIGYHRLFTHRSFKTGRILTTVFGVLGSMAAEGSIIRWSGVHRCHHQHSDRSDDPHSPHGSGENVMGVFKGFFNAHVGWVIRADPRNFARYVPDLKDDRLVRVISALFPLWLAIGLIFPAVLGGLITMSWRGALLGFIWGALVRILLVHHITWSVNSVCHLWGSRPFRTSDHSRNNPFVGVLGFGEGWHNNHHAFPTSARHGLRWWQFDLSYIIIVTLKRLGLAWDVHLPSRDRMASKRLA